MTNAENTKQNPAQKAYDTKKADLANLLGWFECEMKKERKNIDWSDVGNLEHARHELIETLSFLSGIRTDEIEVSLADAGENAKI